MVHTKIVPKLRGDDSKRFREALVACEECLSKNQLSRSRAKVQELRTDLEATGSARFWR